ncbi:MAG: TetR/AcrR family transcriptional regulator [Spirochaetales bacterium]|nr:TetR/AcrR family transcriptional regulator [Spirochaetales bacterium]
MVNERDVIQNKIDKSAQELIFNYGIKGWSMDTCAKDAGITKRTLYHYIDSKENLVERVLVNYIRSVQNELSNRLNAAKDFQAAIDVMIDIFPKLITRMDSRVFRDIFTNYPLLEKKIIEERQSIAKEAYEYILRLKKKGFIKDKVSPEVLIEIIQSLIIYYLKTDPENFETKVKEGFTLVLEGVF